MTDHIDNGEDLLKALDEVSNTHTPAGASRPQHGKTSTYSIDEIVKEAARNNIRRMLHGLLPADELERRMAQAERDLEAEGYTAPPPPADVERRDVDAPERPGEIRVDRPHPEVTVHIDHAGAAVIFYQDKPIWCRRLKERGRAVNVAVAVCKTHGDVKALLVNGEAVWKKEGWPA